MNPFCSFRVSFFGEDSVLEVFALSLEDPILNLFPTYGSDFQLCWIVERVLARVDCSIGNTGGGIMGSSVKRKTSAPLQQYRPCHLTDDGHWMLPLPGNT